MDSEKYVGNCGQMTCHELHRLFEAFHIDKTLLRIFNGYIKYVLETHRAEHHLIIALLLEENLKKCQFKNLCTNFDIFQVSNHLLKLTPTIHARTICD